MLDRRSLLQLALTSGALAQAGQAQSATRNLSDASSSPSDPASPEELRLWPDGPPGAQNVTTRLKIEERPGKEPVITGVLDPLITLFAPKQADGSAILVIPGGGYTRLAGGAGICQWFADKGAHAFLLRYRLAYDGWEAGPDAPFQDAQRAMRVIRDQAPLRGYDPNRIAVLGGSAGGHLAGQLVCRFDKLAYPAVDPADLLSARPTIAKLICPVVAMDGQWAHKPSVSNLLGASPTPEQRAYYSLERHVRPDSPPVFFTHAADDKTVRMENTLMMFAALREKGVAAEMHIFESGGHGYGMGVAGETSQYWPDMFRTWGRKHGV